MRDPKRIKRILDKIEKVWKNSPDLRFHQLIVCIDPRICNQDPFYWEDDEFEEKIDYFIKDRDIK